MAGATIVSNPVDVLTAEQQRRYGRYAGLAFSPAAEHLYYVAFKDGNVYILEFGFTPPSTYTPRVRKLSPDGRITLLATVTENNNPREENGTSSVGETSSREMNRLRRWWPYLTLGVVAGIFVLGIVVWRVRRRRSDHVHPKLSGTA